MTDTNFAVRYRPVKGAEGETVPGRAALLPFEEFLPWREPKSYKGQRNARAYYGFSKTDRHVFCESRLEECVLQGLDFDLDVTAVAAQPFELSYLAGGKRWRHVPDFFVRCARGPDRVVDVKPAREVNGDAGGLRIDAGVSVEPGQTVSIGREPGVVDADGRDVAGTFSGGESLTIGSGDLVALLDGGGAVVDTVSV